MPRTLLVLYSAKSEVTDPRDRIVGLGGDGWTATRKEIIRDIEKGLADYFVVRPDGEAVWVETVRGRDGLKYLKADGDPDEPLTLLSLPDFL